MFRDAKLVQHSIPLRTNFKLFKYFSASTSLNYEEVWYAKQLKKNYDANQSKVVDKIVSGFDALERIHFHQV
jgi:hypothetical protein